MTCGFGNSIIWPNTPSGAVTIFGIATQSAGLVSAGWVGIGTTHPNAPLYVVGNVLVENATFFDVSALRVGIGVGADAAGYISTALGYYTTASGFVSTAMVAQTTASGNYSTALGYEAMAAHDNTFVWSYGSLFYPAFSSTTTNEFSVCVQNGVHIQTDKGIHLHATNAPIIVRDWDVFANNAPSSKAGIGRWGMFTETNTLVMGIPGDDTTGRNFQVAKYNTNGTPTMLMQVDQSGNLTAGGSLTVATNAHVAGLIRSGIETGTSKAPNPAGLVVRRINSTLATSNSIVAMAHTMFLGAGTNYNLMRDGTAGGFQIQYPASPGYVTIACMGIDTNGVTRNFYVGNANPATAGTVQIFTDAQAIVHFECTFGDTYNSGDHLTRVTLSRFYGGSILDNFWSGDLVSTCNQ